MQKIIRLTFIKLEWTCYKLYKEVYDRAKVLKREDTCMKFCDDKKKTLYIETDAFRVGLGAGLL